MYIKNNKTYPDSLLQLAAEGQGMNVEEFAAQKGFTKDESEGKETDPPNKNQSEDQEKVKTDGVSSSVDGSLESTETDLPETKDDTDSSAELQKIADEIKGIKPDAYKSEIYSTYLPLKMQKDGMLHLNLDAVADPSKLIIGGDIRSAFGAPTPRMLNVDYLKEQIGEDRFALLQELVNESKPDELQGASLEVPEELLRGDDGLGPQMLGDIIINPSVLNNKTPFVDPVTGEVNNEELVEKFPISRIPIQVTNDFISNEREISIDYANQNLDEEQRVELFYNLAQEDPVLAEALEEDFAKYEKNQGEIDFYERQGQAFTGTGTGKGTLVGDRAGEKFVAQKRKEDLDKAILSKLELYQANLVNYSNQVENLGNNFYNEYTSFYGDPEKESEGSFLNFVNTKADYEKRLKEFSDFTGKPPAYPFILRNRTEEEILSSAPLMKAQSDYEAELKKFNEELIEKGYTEENYDALYAEYSEYVKTNGAILNQKAEDISIMAEKLAVETEKFEAAYERFSIVEPFAKSFVKNYTALEKHRVAINGFFIEPIYGLTMLAGQSAEFLATKAGLEKWANKFKSISNFAISGSLKLDERKENLPAQRNLKDAISNGEIGAWFVNSAINAVPQVTLLLSGQAASTYIAKRAVGNQLRKRLIKEGVDATAVKGKVLVQTAADKLGKQTVKALQRKTREKAGKLIKRSTATFFGVVTGGSDFAELTKQQKQARGIINEIDVLLDNPDLTEVDRQELEKERAYLENIDDISLGEKLASATTLGIVEGGTEALFGLTSMMGNFRKYNRNANYANMLARGTNKHIAKAASFIKGGFIGATKTYPKEILQETFVLAAQNWRDILLGKDSHMLTGFNSDFVGNVAVAVFLMNSSGQAGNVGTAMMDAISTRKQKRKLKNIALQIHGLKGEIQGLRDGEVNIDIYNEIKRKEEQLETLELSLLKEGVDIGKNLNLTNEDINNLIEADAEIKSLTKQISAELEGGEVANNQTVETLNKLREQQIEKREAILNSGLEKARQKTDAKVKEAAKDENVEVLTLQLLEAYEYNDALVKAYYGDAYIEIPAILEEEIEELELEEGQIPGLSESQIKFLKSKGVSDKRIKKLNEQKQTGRNGSFFTDGSMVVFKDNVVNNIIGGVQKNSIDAAFAVASPLHEAGHSQIRTLGIVKDGKLVGIKNSLIKNVTKHLKNKLTPQQFAIVQERLDRYQVANKGEFDAEELMMLFHDLQVGGFINKETFGAVAGVKSMVNSLLKKSLGDNYVFFKINTAADLSNFIGHWKNRVTSDATGQKLITGTEDDAEDKGSIAAMSNAKVNAIALENLSDGPSQNIIARELPGMVKAQIAKRFNIPPDALNDFADDVVARIYTAQETLKWDGRGELSGYLAQRIAFRIKDVVKSEYTLQQQGQAMQYLGGAGNLDIDDVIAGADVTETVPTVPGYDVAETTEAPIERKRINLLKSNVISDKTSDAIKSAVLSTVRVQKKPFDQKVSINVSTKPYVKEIQNNVKQAAFRGVSVEMGTVKNGDAQAFTRKNKDAIINNLTTSWLSRSMPQVIEKQLESTGEFVPYPLWVGKKIAREKVSTNQAGKTSGNEIVRRNRNITQEQWNNIVQEYFVDESGKEIRGRRDALAKEIAQEIGFDIFAEQMLDPNSEIRQAFERRQASPFDEGGLQAQLTENYLTQLQKDLERGTIKASLPGEFNPTNENHVKIWKNIVREYHKFADGDIFTIIDEKGKIRPGFEETVKYINEDGEEIFVKNIGEYLLNAHLSGAVLDPNETKFKQRLKKSDIVSDETKRVFEKPALTKKSPKKDLDNYAADAAVMANGVEITDENGNKQFIPGLGKEVIEVLGLDILGFHYGVLDAAAGKETDEWQNASKSERSGMQRFRLNADGLLVRGAYYQNKQDILNNATNTELPAGLILEDVRLFNSSSGMMSSHRNKILNNKNLTQAQKIEKMKEFEDEINRANVANILLYKHIVNTLRTQYKAGVISETNIAHLFQMQTSLANGFRALSSYSYFDATEGAIGKTKGEHLGDNSTTSFKIMENIFNKDMTDAEFAARMDLELLRHDQWITNSTKTKIIDSYGTNNPSGDRRIEFAGDASSTFGFDGRSAAEIIKERENAYIAQQQFVNETNWQEYETSKNKIDEILAEDANVQIDEIEVESKASIGRTERSERFNQILERKTGIESFKSFSEVQAQIRGKSKGKFKFFISPAADDFRGLVHYAFSGKGKQGEEDMKFFEDNLMTPYVKGISEMEGVRQQIKREWREVVKKHSVQYKKLNKEIEGTSFTYDHAVRVYLWNQAGIEVPGLSKKDQAILRNAIQENPDLIAFAQAAKTISRRENWMTPDKYWYGGTMLSDLNSMTEKVGRKEYLADFIKAKDEIFTPENLNKIEAAYGAKHREALVDALYSMTNGTNRSQGTSRITNEWLNWVNGSTGNIMFFNRRSALLQTLSATNFVNWSDNNPAAAAKAFANQKQYWTDFAMIFNSDKLKERRGGLKQDVNTNELASIANDSKKSPKAILAHLLKIGYTPTQIADSFAIAAGGATFYRNRVNTYLKQGLDQKAAEDQAFIDFSKKSDETQQSSDPALVSQIQRTPIGRLIFAFQNTPMQYARLMKKAALDLKNGRGDWKENTSKIAYYGFVQSAIFSALQNGMFAMLPGFDEEDEDATKEDIEAKAKKNRTRVERSLNSMLDSVLKGSGVQGTVLATAKNVIAEYYKQEEKGFLGDDFYTIAAGLNISPPIGSKVRKIHSALKRKKFEKDEMVERGWALTADGRLNLGPNYSILGSVVSGVTNVPLDRVVDELTSVSEAFDARNSIWQRLALAAGYKTWDVGAKDEEGEAIKEAAQEKRKEKGKAKAKATRAATKKEKQRLQNEKLFQEIQRRDSIIKYHNQ